MPGGGHGESAGSREALTAALAQSPLPAQAQRDVVRLLFDKVDYLPGLSEADKRKRLSSLCYLHFIQPFVKMHPPALDSRHSVFYGTIFSFLLVLSFLLFFFIILFF